MVLFFAAKIYNNPTFKGLMNKNYADERAMRDSIQRLVANPQINLKTMKFGDYQPLLSDSSTWPNNGGYHWQTEIDAARASLGFGCDYLDACVRRCFNSEPPIPITIDVKEKEEADSTKDTHSIKLKWTYKENDEPERLYLTMLCPFKKTAAP